MYGIAKIFQEIERSAERFRFANRGKEGGILIKGYKTIGRMAGRRTMMNGAPTVDQETQKRTSPVQ